MNSLVAKFAKLFVGYEEAHGQHLLDSKPDETGKLKGKAVTKGTGASPKEYEAHLIGSGTSLGLIPLRKDDTCWFAAVDIDTKGTVKLNETPEQLEGRVRKMELPLVVCRSKSGGAHLYLFGSEPIPAKIAQGKLMQFAANLGYGGTEVFPKQVTRVNENDRGNWINIAYYGALSTTGTTRYAIRNGKPITKLDDFISYAEDMRISAGELGKTELKFEPGFEEAPPCLQHINTYGIGQGSRNNTLINIAVFFKKSDGDHWKDKTTNFNLTKFSPPLPYKEVSDIIEHAERKDYFYTCNQPPICNHCNKKLCLTRAYGIGNGSGDVFPMDRLTKCISKGSVRYYAEQNGERIELTSDELLHPNMLKKKWYERFNRVMTVSSKTWEAKLQELTDAQDTVYDPEDASEQGQFELLLESFFLNSRPARNRDELIKGNSYIEDGIIHFRSPDLMQYLNIHRFNQKTPKIWSWLTELGANPKQMRIKGRMIRVWSLPEPERFDSSTIDLPKDMEEEL